MPKPKFRLALFNALAFLIFATCSADPELLQLKDINKIMKQIFDQHVDKKEIRLDFKKFF